MNCFERQYLVSTSFRIWDLIITIRTINMMLIFVRKIISDEIQALYEALLQR